MHIRKFEEQDFKPYEAWFADHELNAWLGPLDQEWLDHVLAETNGCQLVALQDNVMVGCCGVIFPTQIEDYFFITDISVNPAKKRRGFAKQIIQCVQSEFDPLAKKRWKAIVDESNQAAIGLLLSLGWKRDLEIDDEGMLGFSSTV